MLKHKEGLQHMGKNPSLLRYLDPPNEIVQAGLNGDLVFFVGAGVSMLAGLPSWPELAAKAFDDLRKEGYLNYSEIEQLKNLEPKKQLSIAFSVAEDKKYDLDITKHLRGKSNGDSIFDAINNIGCPCVTTNYDELLAPSYFNAKDGSITDESVNRIYDKDKFFANLLNKPGVIIHLHGAISKPETMIVTTKQYLKHYDNANVQEFLGQLFKNKIILFLGYSLEEAEILEHILRRGKTKPTKERKLFALQGFYEYQEPLYHNLYTYYKKSFGVHLLGFIRDYEGYKCLEIIIKNWATQLKVRKPPLAADYDFMNEVLGDEISNLSVREQDLLQRIGEKEELRPLFFRNVKGLIWFDSLSEHNYFNPEANPKPVPAEEEGYVNIPNWHALDYLVKTASELNDKKNIKYSEKFFRIIVIATNYAQKNKFSNYRTWWKFAEIISQIPYKSIPIEGIDLIDYWLDDKYNSDLVASVIGEKWLPSLLQNDDDYALQLSTRIIDILYKVTFTGRRYGKINKQKASFRFDYNFAQKTIEQTATLAGEKLGLKVIQIFHKYLVSILEELDNDSLSSLWQPAIEDHEQNKHLNDAENILIQAYRDVLDSYIRVNPVSASEYVKNILMSKYQTIQRLAIHVICENYNLFTDSIGQLLNDKYMNSNYQHEMWHFFKKNYPNFSSSQKEKVLELISGITRYDNKGKYHAVTTAYKKAVWLSAIKEHGDREADLYLQSTEIAKTEPDHPDFSSYMSEEWRGAKSPKTIEELQTLPIDELVHELENYKDPGRFDDPGLEGLLKVFKQLIKTDPINFCLNLDKFLKLDLAYIYEIIEAYRELWTEKSNIPWDGIWQKLLEFCSDVIGQSQFWSTENEKQRELFIANRYWIVSSICRLIDAGTKSDEHAFDMKHLPSAEAILVSLLKQEKGDEYKEDSDAVMISINSPRGHCVEALINLTLRSCRIADKNNNKDHSKVWENFKHLYDSELDRADSENPEYEFATLVTYYLSNFLYMSEQWVLENLNRIFDQYNYLKWLCAIQGYAYIRTIYPKIYKYLKEHGDLLKVLDDKNIRDNAEEKAIQNIALAYINDFESFEEEDSLINLLISRNDCEEIKHLVWFMWTLKNIRNEKLINKIYELWPKILDIIDLSKREGQNIASQLCLWTVFVDHVDKDRQQLLLAIAPYSDESHNSHVLLERISEISDQQPFEAHEIWMEMLKRSTPDYPEEAIRNIFTNLLKIGPEGLSKAREAESAYLKNGNDGPSLWLKEIRQEKFGLQ